MTEVEQSFLRLIAFAREHMGHAATAAVRAELAIRLGTFLRALLECPGPPDPETRTRMAAIAEAHPDALDWIDGEATSLDGLIERTIH